MTTTEISPLTARTDHAETRRALRDLIERGVYGPGERLPAERELAQMLSLPRHKVRQALGELVEEGMVSTNGARMRFVSDTLQTKGVLTKAVFTFSLCPRQIGGDSRASGWSDQIDNGVRTQLQEEGWHNLALHPRHLGQEWQSIARERPTGVLLSNLNDEDQDLMCRLLGEFQAAKVPVVVYGDEPQWQSFDRVTSDQFAGSALLTRYFLGREQQQIAMVCSPRDAGYNWFGERRAGYEGAMRAANLEPLPLLSIPFHHYRFTPAQWESDVRLVAGELERWFARHPQTEVLQIVSDDAVPLFGEALKRLGKQPNVDVWLAGYDNYWSDGDDYQTDRAVPCATIDKHNELCGHQMVRLLQQRIAGELPAAPQLRLVEPRLILT